MADGRRQWGDPSTWSDSERWALGHVIVWRIMLCMAAGAVAAYALRVWLVDLGASDTLANIVVFLIANATLFAACIGYWRRAELPFAPDGWRSGAAARIAIVVFVVHASLLTLAPWEMQLSVALIVAAVKLNA